jgi:hypothetical protein
MFGRARSMLALSVATLLSSCGDGGPNGTAPIATEHGWGVAQPINSETYDVLNSPSEAHVRFMPQGDALATWIVQEQHGLTSQQAPAFIGQVHAAHYDPHVGWGSERSIDIQAGAAYGTQLEIDRDGNAMSVWFENLPSPGLNSLYTNRYSATSGWGNATLLTSDGKLGPDPQIAFDSVGNALAVWTAWGTQPPQPEYPVQTFATRYANGRGWAVSIDNIDNCGQPATAATYGAALCSQTGYLQSYDPEVKFDGDGNAIAVWVEMNLFAQSQRVYANRYVAATGSWGSPQPLSDDFVDGGVQLGVDNSGNAWAIWPSGGQIRVAGYTAAAGWGTVQSLGPATEQEPDVAFDSSGNALAVWTNMTSSQGGNTWTLYAARYTPAGGWASPVRVDCADSNPADASQTCQGGIVDPQIAFDTSGNAFVVWSYAELPQPYQNEPYRQGQIYANRYILNKGWDVPQSIDVKAGLASKPQIAVDANGHALAIWAENGQIYVNRFD